MQIANCVLNGLTWEGRTRSYHGGSNEHRLPSMRHSSAPPSLTFGLNVVIRAVELHSYLPKLVVFEHRRIQPYIKGTLGVNDQLFFVFAPGTTPTQCIIVGQ